MKTLLLISLICLVGCGKEGAVGQDGRPLCKTREEVRNICFVEEMAKLGHDSNMTQWVKDYCANIYKTEGCY